jgi:hypothetical protein
MTCGRFPELRKARLVFEKVISQLGYAWTIYGGVGSQVFGGDSEGSSVGGGGLFLLTYTWFTRSQFRMR